MSDENEYLRIEEDIVAALRTVYDPEIPVNVYDLGLIYCVELTDDKFVTITMTLTAPNCPAADFILEDVRLKVEDVEEWNKDMMSEEAMLELGFL